MGTGFDGETDAVRRRFLIHESVVWTIGWLYLIGAAFTVLMVIGMVIALSAANEAFAQMPNREVFRAMFIAMTANQPASRHTTKRSRVRCKR